MDKNTMAKLSYGVYVVTAKDGNDYNGCIINTATQIVYTPNIMIVALNKTNHTHDMLKKTKKLCLSVISTDAKPELFERFGFQSGRDVNKFENYDKVKGASNELLYIEDGTNAYICGDVEKVLDFGSHSMFVVKVTDAQIISDAESMTYAYYHEHVKPELAKRHSDRAKIQADVEGKGKSGNGDGKPTKKWVCKVCGYVYEGDELPEDYICPLCKHGAEDFELIEE